MRDHFITDTYDFQINTRRLRTRMEYKEGKDCQGQLPKVTTAKSYRRSQDLQGILEKVRELWEMRVLPDIR